MVVNTAGIHHHPAPVRVVGKTTESIYFSCYVLPGAFHLPPGLVEAREQAVAEREAVYFSVKTGVFIEGFDGNIRGKKGEIVFQVNRAGSSSGYFFVLRNDDLSIEAQRTASVSSPVIYVQLRARLIWAVGYQAAVEWAHRLVAEMFGRVNKSILSRVDFTVDVQGWNLQAADLPRFVGRSKHQGRYKIDAPQLDQDHFWHGQFTGLAFSKGSDLACNIYDKQREIAARKTKTWFYDIWRSNGWDGKSKIWRVEFQVKRKILREFGLTKGAVSDLNAFDGIWQYLTREWLRFCVADRTRKWNWNTSPEWGVIQAATFNQRASAPAVRRREQKAPALAVLVPMLRGVGTSLGAQLGCETPEQVIRMMGVCFTAEERREGMEPEILKKRVKYSKMEVVQVDDVAERLRKLTEQFGHEAAMDIVYGEEFPGGG